MDQSEERKSDREDPALRQVEPNSIAVENVELQQEEIDVVGV